VIISGTPSIDHQSPLPEVLPEPANNARTKPLLDLFDQIMALAIRLRQRADLPNAEYAVLEMIHRFGPMTVPQIARARSTSRQNIQILIDRLEAIGRVGLTGNPAHKKSLLVQITENGKASLAASETAQKDFLLELGSRLSEAEVRGTISVLSKVRSLLSADREENVNPDQGQHPKPLAGPVSPSGLKAIKGAEAPVEEFPINLL
jgi:DNA-binding MarR family transcriptional regulator